MSLVGDMILQTANAPGTGPFNLIAPPPGRSSFVGQAGAGQVYYFAEDATGWEKAIGTVSSGSPDSLTRDTVLGNSLGTTARINFAGPVTIICDIPAERSLWANAAGDVLLGSNRRISTLVNAIDLQDAAARNQVGVLRTNSVGVSNGAFLLPIPSLPAGAAGQVVSIDFRSVVSTGNAPYFFRLSTDNAASYLSDQSEYKYSLFTMADGGNAENNGFASYVPLTAALDHVSAMTGTLDLDPVTHQWMGRTVGVNAATGRYIQNLSGGNSVTNVPPTHILISAVGQNLTGGMARISQKVF